MDCRYRKVGHSDDFRSIESDQICFAQLLKSVGSTRSMCNDLFYYAERSNQSNIIMFEECGVNTFLACSYT